MVNDLHRIVADALPDRNPEETREWVDALKAVVTNGGEERAKYIVRKLLAASSELGIDVRTLPLSDYVNTIPADQEPDYPGDMEIEERIRHHLRWNAAAIVQRGQRPGLGVGGHIATYQSTCHLYEVGFNHYFRGKDHPGGGDHIYMQGHGSPGAYSRAFLEGRMTEWDLDHFRQTTKGGLAAYPHPRLMPNFWEFPTVNMGLGTINSVYQARYNRYLHNRGLKDTSDQRIWAFIGDGEMDEPEAQGALTVAARDGLDNLTWVVNCNLQRLDGPVLPNGKIVQQLEGQFAGAGWNVIKVLWGPKWDRLIAMDSSGELVQKLNTTPDGQFQTFTARDAAYVKEHFFNTPALRNLLEKSQLTDNDLPVLDRGGHNVRKINAAFDAAVNHKGRPTVILAQTVKGWSLGKGFMSANANHQMKKLSIDQFKAMRDRLELNIPDSALVDPYQVPYVSLDHDPEAKEYLLERRRELGGFLPERREYHSDMALPEPKRYDAMKKGSGDAEVATTMGLVRLMRDLIKVKGFGERIVPITPDEARTFGIDSMFNQLGIYSPQGMQYDPVDSDMLMSYRTATDGQILNEGITECGCMAIFQAAGTSHSTHGVEMLPMFYFYSMFGLQRIGDSVWQAADMRARGFIVGCTAGRTTLNGEGLQHQDGNSILYAVANPSLITYDPSFVFEVAVIVEEGIRRMMGKDAEDVMFYLTVYNEPTVQPAIPADLDPQEIIDGIYCFRESDANHTMTAQIIASGSAMTNALKAQEILAAEYNVAADVWSAPGWVGLHREAVEALEWNREHPTEEPRIPLVTEKLEENSGGPFVAVTDFVNGVPGLIAPYMPEGKTLAILGTDGFGRADTREALRRAFRIDAESIVVAVLYELAEDGEIDYSVVEQALRKYEMNYEDIPVNNAPA